MKFTRRNFLKQGLCGALLLGASALPDSLKAAVGEMEIQKKLKSKRVVILALDGICVAGFKQAHTPNLDALLAEGVLSTETRVVMPSVTLPNWTSHLTGSGPEQHGVTDNEWTINRHTLPSVESDGEGYYPSVFSVLKQTVPGIKTAFYYNWKPLAYPYNPKNLDEASFLPDDNYVENYDKAFNFIVNHSEEPALVFIYSVHTDHAGHKYKWMSPEYIKSIEEADVEIGKFINKMKQNSFYEDTYFFFVTDHGGLEYGHGGVSTDEMIVPWGVAGPEIVKGKELKEANNTVNTAATILRLFGVEQYKPLCWTSEVPESIFD